MSNDDDHTPIRLKTAAEEFFPDGGITVRVLREHAHKGHLQAFRLGNKDFTTGVAMKDFIEWLAVHSRLGSGSKSRTPARGSGSSGTKGKTSAQAALNQILEARKKR